MSNSVRPHGRQLTRLCCPWDSPGKNTRMGCHFLLQCMKVKSESEVTQSCPTLRDPMDWSPPSSSIHGIFQARVLSGLPLPSRLLRLTLPNYLPPSRNTPLSFSLNEFKWKLLFSKRSTLWLSGTNYRPSLCCYQLGILDTCVSFTKSKPFLCIFKFGL